MRVLLINPPAPDGAVWVREGRCQQFDIWGTPFPPLTLAYIRAQVNDVAEVRLLDPQPAGLAAEAVFADLAAFKPDLMIMSVTTPTFAADTGWFAAKAKELVPGLLVGATGIHVTALPEESLARAPQLDFVIRGEPEPVARPLVQALASGRGLGPVPGVSWRRDGAVAANPAPPVVEDLDAFGFPDWSGLDFRHYTLPIKDRPFTLVSFARGCPFPCRYCAAHAFYGKRIRRRSIPSLLAEIRRNIALGVRDYLFWTEMISGDAAFLEAFCEALIREDLHREIAWVCNARADQLSERLLPLMRRAGCWQMALGLEFGTDKALKLANKGGRMSVAVAREAVTGAARSGIALDGHFILGYPGEERADLETTIRFAASLPLTFAHFYTAVPFPGAELYAASRERLGLDAKWDLIRQDRHLFGEVLPEAELHALVRRAYRCFYLSPRRVVLVLGLARNPREFLGLLKTGAVFLLGLLKPGRP